MPNTPKSFPICCTSIPARFAPRCARFRISIVVTDSTSASGMPDGEYRLGSQHVTKCMGGVRLADGTLAGRTLTMDQALRNLVNEMKLDLRDASRRVSTNAADYLGIRDRGRLTADAFADIVVMDRDLNLVDVFCEGNSCSGISRTH